MANVAIEIRVGKHPNHYEQGIEYHFSIGGDDEKLSSETIMNFLEDVIEKEITKKWGEISLPI